MHFSFAFFCLYPTDLSLSIASNRPVHRWVGLGQGSQRSTKEGGPWRSNSVRHQQTDSPNLQGLLVKAKVLQEKKHPKVLGFVLIVQVRKNALVASPTSQVKFPLACDLVNIPSWLTLGCLLPQKGSLEKCFHFFQFLWCKT